MTTITTIGRITNNFELRTSDKNGCVYANFSLAVNEGFGDKQRTTFFECSAFGSDAERLIKARAKKGSLIQVTGKFGTSEFSRSNGEKGYSLKIAVLAWSYIPGAGGQKDANSENGENINKGTDDNNARTPVHNSEPLQSNDELNGITNLDDDDLPF